MPFNRFNDPGRRISFLRKIWKHDFNDNFDIELSPKKNWTRTPLIEIREIIEKKSYPIDILRTQKSLSACWLKVRYRTLFIVFFSPLILVKYIQMNHSTCICFIQTNLQIISLTSAFFLSILFCFSVEHLGICIKFYNLP